MDSVRARQAAVEEKLKALEQQHDELRQELQRLPEPEAGRKEASPRSCSSPARRSGTSTPWSTSVAGPRSPALLVAALVAATLVAMAVASLCWRGRRAAAAGGAAGGA